MLFGNTSDFWLHNVNKNVSNKMHRQADSKNSFSTCNKFASVSYCVDVDVEAINVDKAVSSC